MKLAERAKATGMSVQTIRSYGAGLLPEAFRTGSSYRTYGTSHAERLAFFDTAARWT